MKITAERVVSAYEILLKGMREQQERQAKLPVKAAYRIARLVALLEPEYLTLQKARLEIVKRLGEELKAKPGTWQVLPENVQAFQAEWGEITKEEIEVPCDPIPLSQMGDGSFFTIGEMFMLGNLVVDETSLRLVH